MNGPLCNEMKNRNFVHMLMQGCSLQTNMFAAHLVGLMKTLGCGLLVSVSLDSGYWPSAVAYAIKGRSIDAQAEVKGHSFRRRTCCATVSIRTKGMGTQRHKWKASESQSVARRSSMGVARRQKERAGQQPSASYEGLEDTQRAHASGAVAAVPLSRSDAVLVAPRHGVEQVDTTGATDQTDRGCNGWATGTRRSPASEL